MNIKIGSTNKIKVEAMQEILQDYPHLKNAIISAVEIPSSVADQPKSLEETVQGATNRAKGAFQDCAYSFGIESGLMAVPNTKSGFMDVCVCAIFDGNEYHLGLSSAWEAPKQVMRHMLAEGREINKERVHKGSHKNRPYSFRTI